MRDAIDASAALRADALRGARVHAMQCKQEVHSVVCERVSARARAYSRRRVDSPSLSLSPPSVIISLAASIYGQPHTAACMCTACVCARPWLSFPRATSSPSCGRARSLRSL